MHYLFKLAGMALQSDGAKRFTLEDGHVMTISPIGDGKTMEISIEDGASYQTRGVDSFIKQIEKILKNRGVAWWDEAKEGQGDIYQVLSMYEQFGDVQQEEPHKDDENKYPVNIQ